MEMLLQFHTVNIYAYKPMFTMQAKLFIYFPRDKIYFLGNRIFDLKHFFTSWHVNFIHLNILKIYLNPIPAVE